MPTLKSMLGASPSTRSRLITASFALVAALAVTPDLSAQTDAERAGARAAAEQGAKAFSEGRFADAVDLFRRAESLVHAPPHLLYMARSQEKLGKLVEARETYLKLRREELPTSAPDAFRKAQADGYTELQALEPRVPYLTITLRQPAPEGTKVLIDGAEVPVALLGVEGPVNPGKHQVVATVGGVEGQVHEVNLAEGVRDQVEIEAPQAALVSDSGPASGSAATAEDQGMGSSGPNQGMRIGSYVAFGVGGVGLIGGTVFLVAGLGKQSDSDEVFDGCAARGCSETEQQEISDLDDEAASAKTLSVVGYGVGVAGIATGITLLILSNSGSGSEANAAPAPRIQPWVGWQSAGITGTF